MKFDSFDLNRKISSAIAFTIIIVLSLSTAWYALRSAEEIIKIAPNSATFNLDKRIKNK